MTDKPNPFPPPPPPPPAAPPPIPGKGPPGPPPPPLEIPDWVKFPDPNEPATMLPPWPDRMLREPMKAAALVWVDRLSVPLRFKRGLLASWGAYTGVAITPEDFARLSDIPKGGRRF